MLGFTTLATIEYFKVNPVAGYLMASYVGWQCFVTALNYKIWKDNQTGGKEEKVSVPAGFPPAKWRLCTSGDATTTLLSDERSGESSRFESRRKQRVQLFFFESGIFLRAWLL